MIIAAKNSYQDENNILIPMIEDYANLMEKHLQTLAVVSHIDVNVPQKEELFPEMSEESLKTEIDSENNNVDECPVSPPISLNEQFHFNHFDAFTPEDFIAAPPDLSDDEFASNRTMRSSTIDSDIYGDDDSDGIYVVSKST